MALSVCWTGAARGDESTLAEALREARAEHRLLFQLADRYDARYAENLNISDPVLRNIVVPVDQKAVDGELRIEVHPGFLKVRNYFQALWIEGESMDKAKAIDLERDGVAEPLKWVRYGNGILIRPYAMDPGDARRFTLRIDGAINPKHLRWHVRDISSRFDPSPYVGVGENRPRRSIEATVSTRHFRSIGGISELDRTRFFRIYSQPGNERYPNHLDELDALGFQQGRQMFKFGPSLEHRHGATTGPFLREDPDRPGYHDPSFFAEFKADNYRDVPSDLEFVMCFDNWPSFMEVEIPGHNNKRGTPKDFDAAAELVVDYLNDQIADSGRTATWWEVKNEPDVLYEWTYHGDPNADSWGLLAEFHNTVAKAVHERVDPNIKIGGPTAAYPAFQAGDFGRWKHFQRFQDETAEHLDFFSYHFYDPAVFGPGDPHGYTDARLDMIQSHMHTTGNVLPLVVSEFGVYGQPARATAEGRKWVIVKGIGQYWMRFLERPEQFDIVVPFMLGFIHWNLNDDVRGVWATDENGKFIRTPSYDVMRLWSEFSGKRVPVSSPEPGLLRHAVLDGNTLYVALHNLTEDRLNVDLKLDSDAGVKSIRQKRQYYTKGELRYEDEVIDSLDALPVNVSETTIVIVEFDSTPRTAGTLAERSFYGADTAVPNTGKPIAFEIDVPEDVASGGIKAAELRLSMHAKNGSELGKSVRVEINGQAVDHSLERFGDAGYFGYTRIVLPPDAIAQANTIRVTFAKPGGTFAAARLVVTYPED
ncbi:MAG: hypothetical protein AAF797_00330 [Planctomycetota bacterium]